MIPTHMCPHTSVCSDQHSTETENASSQQNEVQTIQQDRPASCRRLHVSVSQGSGDWASSQCDNGPLFFPDQIKISCPVCKRSSVRRIKNLPIVLRAARRYESTAVAAQRTRQTTVRFMSSQAKLASVAYLDRARPTAASENRRRTPPAEHPSRKYPPSHECTSP